VRIGVSLMSWGLIGRGGPCAKAPIARRAPVVQVRRNSKERPSL
jgi:hypothetical protein